MAVSSETYRLWRRRHKDGRVKSKGRESTTPTPTTVLRLGGRHGWKDADGSRTCFEAIFGVPSRVSVQRPSHDVGVREPSEAERNDELHVLVHEDEPLKSVPPPAAQNGVVLDDEQGEVTGSLNLEDQVLASPAAASGGIFLRSNSRLWKLADVNQ